MPQENPAITTKKKVLIGITEESLRKGTGRLCNACGCDYFLALNLEELQTEARDSAYTHCVMDLNFPLNGALTIEPARRIYDVLKPRAESGLFAYVGISGRPEVVEMATASGIPAHLKPFDLLKFLGN